LEIIICEDNNIQRERIERIVNKAIEKHELNMNINLSTANPNDVLSVVRTHQGVTRAYILDISLNADINGLSLAREIRHYDSMGFIVFVTTHSELTTISFEYKVEALDFILKDNPYAFETRIEECLLTIEKKLQDIRKGVKNFLTVDTGTRILNICLDDIIFIETTEKIHKLRIHTYHGQFEFYGKMKEVEGRLPEGFYRSHTSYLVNIEKIQEIDKASMSIIMCNGETCFISLRGLKGLMDQCTK